MIGFPPFSPDIRESPVHHFGQEFASFPHGTFLQDLGIDPTDGTNPFVSLPHLVSGM
jgi:hypothetical protein